MLRRSGGGGGGMANSGGALTLTNITLSGNKAIGAGGGIRTNNSGSITATLNLNNVTIFTNTADYDGSGAGHGGGISIGSGNANLQNTLIAGNVDNSASSKQPDCGGTLTSQGYNLLGNNTGCTMTPATGDQVGTGGSPINPKLGVLANNGGPSLTHALLSGSPAIDAANPAAPGSGGGACAATDQRWAVRPVDGDGNGSALCDIGAYEAGVAAPPTGVVITYLYDNLYRLLAASYSTGLSFNYTYDPVGNRLAQTTLAGTTVYTYDIANRLTNVGSQAYTWDNNGNLLNDGVFTSTYDSANRLITIMNGINTTRFTHNGLDDRVGEIDNGVVTTYTLDLAVGLTQVLADGTNTYVYGQGRIGQFSGSGAQYFLPDGLGSVRQLANSTGGVALARGYEPYGSVLSTVGTGTTSYGFTGEWTNSQTGLIDLRARWYAPTQGRFLTKDTWPGSYIKLGEPGISYGGSGTGQVSTGDWYPDYSRPQSLNGWAYSEGNPVNRTDPSGHFSCSFANAAVERHITGIGERGGLEWSSCEAPIEHVLTVLQNDGGFYSSFLVGAFREADANEGVSVSFIDGRPGTNPNGGRDSLPPYHGHLILDAFGLPIDLAGNAGSLSDVTLDYISIVGHELWHAVMQPGGVANTPPMESEAFQVQTHILRELGGPQFGIDSFQGIADNVTAHGYSWNFLSVLSTCGEGILGTITGGIVADHAVRQRRMQLADELGKLD